MLPTWLTHNNQSAVVLWQGWRQSRVNIMTDLSMLRFGFADILNNQLTTAKSKDSFHPGEYEI
jgi:hypothetical protein